VVDEAEDVASAFAQINHVLKSNEMYDCAILDFRLPRADGGEEVDFNICAELRDKMASTGIIHISTAAKTDSHIHRHILDYHTGLEKCPVLSG
jgi:DNA-binding response OmpR family regulator